MSVAIGWASSRTEVSTAGRRGSESVDEAVAGDLRDERERDEPAVGRPARNDRSRSPTTMPASAATTTQAADASNSVPNGRRPSAVPLPDDEQVPGVARARPQTERDTERRIRPVGAVLEQARDEQDAARPPRAWPATSAGPGCSPRSSQPTIATMTTWRLGMTVPSPAPTNSTPWWYRVRSLAKKAPGRDRREVASPRPRPLGARLAPGEECQERQRVQAAEDGRGRRRDPGVAVEDPAERDGHRAKEGGEARLGLERGERPGRATGPGARVRSGPHVRTWAALIVNVAPNFEKVRVAFASSWGFPFRPSPPARMLTVASTGTPSAVTRMSSCSVSTCRPSDTNPMSRPG